VKKEYKALYVGLAIGLFAGYVGNEVLNGNSYMLKESGVEGVVYKVNTRTGKTWMVYGQQETPVQEGQRPASQ
jgi:hypothetical protein